MDNIAFRSAARFPRTEEILSGKDLRGKTAIVTGASGGLGLAMAAALTKAGANVFAVSRAGAKLQNAIDALRRLKQRTPSRIEAVGLDLANLDSVDAAADAILGSGDKIDVLINNAGVIGPKTLSSIGVEMGFMTNVVGHAVLTSRLAPTLKTGARIACLSSFGHHYSPVMFDDINFEHRPYSAWSSYGQSKTGSSLLAVKFSRALGARGIDAFALHPGAIQTEMGRSMVQEDFDLQIEKTGEIAPDDFMTPDQGAATAIWAVTEPRLAGMGGLYLENCAVAEVRDVPDYRSGVMRYAVDPDLADRLWNTVEELTGRTLPLS